MKKAIISGIVATVAGGLILSVLGHIFSNETPTIPVQQYAAHPPVSLDLTGSNNNLYISAGNNGAILSAMSIKGSNLEREICLPKGQLLRLNVLGSNNKIKISKLVFSQVTVTEIGSNNSISKAFIGKSF